MPCDYLLIPLLYFFPQICYQVIELAVNCERFCEVLHEQESVILLSLMSHTDPVQHSHTVLRTPSTVEVLFQLHVSLIFPMSHRRSCICLLCIYLIKVFHCSKFYAPLSFCIMSIIRCIVLGLWSWGSCRISCAQKFTYNFCAHKIHAHVIFI